MKNTIIALVVIALIMWIGVAISKSIQDRREREQQSETAQDLEEDQSEEKIENEQSIPEPSSNSVVPDGKSDNIDSSMSQNNQSNSSTRIQTSPGAEVTVRVSINNNSFGSDTLQVSPNTTVIWTNNDSVDHTVTSDNGKFDSGTIKPGGIYEYKVTETGEFPYHCNLHSNMKSTLIVK